MIKFKSKNDSPCVACFAYARNAAVGWSSRTEWPSSPTSISFCTWYSSRFQDDSTRYIRWRSTQSLGSLSDVSWCRWKHLIRGSMLAQGQRTTSDLCFPPLVIADLVLVLGTKTTRPAFLTMWLIVVGISIVLMVVIASLGIVSFAVGWVEKPHCHLSINS